MAIVSIRFQIHDLYLVLGSIRWVLVYPHCLTEVDGVKGSHSPQPKTCLHKPPICPQQSPAFLLRKGSQLIMDSQQIQTTLLRSAIWLLRGYL